jgi:gentisate 1,2-dioxygenase
MPTMATAIRLVPEGFETRTYRATDSAVVIVVEGRGSIRIKDRNFDLAAHDVVVVPGWMAHSIRSEHDLVLFSYSDRVSQEKLGIFREGRA